VQAAAYAHRASRGPAAPDGRHLAGTAWRGARRMGKTGCWSCSRASGTGAVARVWPRGNP